MANNTLNALFEYYSNLNGKNKVKNEIIELKDVEDSFESVEQIGRIVFDSEEI